MLPGQTKAGQQNVTKIILLAFVNLIVPKDGAKCQKETSNPKAGGQFFEQNIMLSSSIRCDQTHKCHLYNFGHTLLRYLSQTQMFQQTHFGLLTISSCLAAALGKGKILTIIKYQDTFFDPARVRLKCLTNANPFVHKV